MKNITYSLMPLAALAIFAACAVSVFGLLVVLMTSVGFAGELPLSYYQRLNVGVISVLLPTVGMLLFAVILVGLSRKPAEVVKPIVIEDAINPPMNKEEKREEPLVKAA